MYSDFQDYLTEAIETVLTWDLPEDSVAGAIQDQACLLAGIRPEEWHYACN